MQAVPAHKHHTTEVHMDDRYMKEMTLEEQQNVCGGDWYESAYLYLDSLVLGLAML